ESVLKKSFEHYSVVRGLSRRLNEPRSDDPFVASYALLNTTTFSEVKQKIDNAVRQQKWLVFMLHGVVEEPSPDGLYDISREFLHKILETVAKIGNDVIKPVTFNEVTRLRKADPPTKRFYKPNITDAGAYTLADAPGYMITYHKNDRLTDKVVISFGGLPSKKTSSGFGSKFILKQGYDHIFVAQAARTQYQQLPLADFLEAVEPYVNDKEVYTYGSSLGAYAALYYGGAVNASIIASAPKNSAHPSMVKKRFSHIHFSHSELKDTPRAPVAPLILYDPFRSEETRFIKNWVLPAYPDAYLIKLPYAGHLALQSMQEAGVLKDFITSYIDHSEIIPFELKREGSYTWHAEKGHRHRANADYAEAKKHYRKSLKIHQTGEAVAGLARILLRENRAETAHQLLEEYRAKTGGYKDVPISLREHVEAQRMKS